MRNEKMEMSLCQILEMNKVHIYETEIQNHNI